MAEAYLAGYQSAETAYTDSTEQATDSVVLIADEFGEWITDYEMEVHPEPAVAAGASPAAALNTEETT